jgi:hypothetical protein
MRTSHSYLTKKTTFKDQPLKSRVEKIQWKVEKTRILTKTKPITKIYKKMSNFDNPISKSTTILVIITRTVKPFTWSVMNMPKVSKNNLKRLSTNTTTFFTDLFFP